MSLGKLAFTEGGIELTKPQLSSGNSYPLVLISSPQCSNSSCWWCLDREDDKEESSDQRSSPTMVHCNASTDFLFKPFSFIIAYVDPDVAGKTVVENNTHLCSYHWPGDDELIFPIVTTIDHTTVLLIVNTAIGSLPDPSWKIRELWGCQEERYEDGGPHARNVTPIVDSNTAARWVKASIKIHNLMLCSVVYRGQQADGTSGAQTSLGGGHSYRYLDDNLSPPAEHMMDNMGEESHDDAETQCQQPWSIAMIQTGFQRFEWKHPRRIIRQQCYLEVIQNHAIGLFANYKEWVVADEDVGWLRDYHHNVNPPTAGCLANTKCTSSRPAAK